MANKNSLDLVSSNSADQEMSARRAAQAQDRQERRQTFVDKMVAEAEAREARCKRYEQTKAGRNARARRALQGAVTNYVNKLREERLDAENRLLTKQLDHFTQLIQI